MADKVLRLGVVGLGHRGIHMFQLATTAFPEALKGIAICDSNEEILNATAEKFPEATPYKDFYEMLDHAELDALLVETPAHCHAAFCVEGRKRNLYVFGEIPCVASLEEAKALWEADSKATGGFFMTGANPNVWGFIEALHDYYQRGLLGKPYYMEAEYIHDCRYLWESTPWRRTMYPITYCTHSLGPLLRITDEDLRQVSCLDTGGWVMGGKDEHDLMTAHFQAPSGLVVRFTASFINNAGCGNHSYRVFGTEGYFERLSSRGQQKPITTLTAKKLYGFEKNVIIPVEEGRPEYASQSRGFEGHGGADFVLWHQFVQAIQQGGPVPISLREGLRMTIPGIFARESAIQHGKMINITYPWD